MKSAHTSLCRTADQLDISEKDLSLSYKYDEEQGVWYWTAMHSAFRPTGRGATPRKALVELERRIEEMRSELKPRLTPVVVTEEELKWLMKRRMVGPD